MATTFTLGDTLAPESPPTDDALTSSVLAGAPDPFDDVGSLEAPPDVPVSGLGDQPLTNSFDATRTVGIDDARPARVSTPEEDALLEESPDLDEGLNETLAFAPDYDPLAEYERKVTINVVPEREEYDAWRDREDAKGIFANAVEFGGGVLGGLHQVATDMTKLGVGTADALHLLSDDPANVSGALADQVRRTEGTRVGATEMSASAMEAASKWFVNLGLLGQTLVDGVPSLGGLFTGRDEDYARLVRKIERQAVATPPSSQAGGTAAAFVGAIGGDSDLAKTMQENLAAKANGQLSAGMQFVPDIALGLSSGMAARLTSRALAPTALGKAMAATTAATTGTAGVASARVAQIVDSGLRRAVLSTQKLPGAAETLVRGVVQAPGATTGAIIASVMSGGADAGLLTGIGARVAPKVANLGVQVPLAALRLAGGMSAAAARALKVRAEYGMGAGINRRMFASLAADPTLPSWVRATAGSAHATISTQHGRLLAASGVGFVAEGAEEALQESLNAGSSFAEAGRAAGGGGFFGAGFGAGLSITTNADTHLQDVDALHYRQNAVARGDDPGLFDRLTPDTRRAIGAMQGAALDSTNIRLVDSRGFADALGQRDGVTLADGAYKRGGDVFINMDRVGGNDKALLSTIGHELGHAAYHNLPQRSKEQWRALARETYGDETIEQFRAAYQDASKRPATTDTALDEMFAEQFLGYGSTGKKLLTKKRQISGVKNLRTVRALSDGVRKALGVESTLDPDVLQFDYSPYKNSPEIASFLDSSLRDLGNPLPKLPMPKASKLDEQTAETLDQALQDPNMVTVELPNGKVVAPVGVTAGQRVRYVDMDELTQAMRAVISPDHTDSSKVTAAVAQAKRAGQTPDNAVSSTTTPFAQQTKAILDNLTHDADPSQFRSPNLSPARAGTRQASNDPADIISAAKRIGRAQHDTDREFNAGAPAGAEAGTGAGTGTGTGTGKPIEGLRPLAIRTEETSERSPAARQKRDAQLRSLKEASPPATPDMLQRTRQADASGQGGSEHSVHMSPDSETVVKVWRQWAEGGDTPWEYAERNAILNKYFDAGIKIEGFTDDGGIITSHPFRKAADSENVHPTQVQLSDYMAERGFERRYVRALSPWTYTNKRDRLTLFDVRPVNAILTQEGPVLIDALVDFSSGSTMFGHIIAD